MVEPELALATLGDIKILAQDLVQHSFKVLLEERRQATSPFPSFLGLVQSLRRPSLLFRRQVPFATDSGCSVGES